MGEVSGVYPMQYLALHGLLNSAMLIYMSLFLFLGNFPWSYNLLY